MRFSVKNKNESTARCCWWPAEQAEADQTLIICPLLFSGHLGPGYFGGSTFFFSFFFFFCIFVFWLYNVVFAMQRSTISIVPSQVLLFVTSSLQLHFNISQTFSFVSSQARALHGFRQCPCVWVCVCVCVSTRFSPNSTHSSFHGRFCPAWDICFVWIFKIKTTQKSWWTYTVTRSTYTTIGGCFICSGLTALSLRVHSSSHSVCVCVCCRYTSVFFLP